MRHNNLKGLLGQGRAGTQAHLAHKESARDWDQSFTFLYQVYLDAEWSRIYLYPDKYLY